MAKLNQVIAVEKRVKSEANAVLTKAYHESAKAPLLAGVSRTYQPKDDDGDVFPPESTKVQLRVDALLEQVGEALTGFYDLTLTKDVGNTVAKATVNVGDVVIAEGVPVTYLLFLEKQLLDLSTFIAKLPVLDPADTWAYNIEADAYATPAVKTVKTKKIPRNHELAPATDRHPAQVQVFTEDVVIGYWSTVKFSGAIPLQQLNGLKEKVGLLLDAVKRAREEANTVTVTEQKIGERIFDYLYR